MLVLKHKQCIRLLNAREQFKVLQLIVCSLGLAAFPNSPAPSTSADRTVSLQRLCLIFAAGVELGGALKNVLAIACGISDGVGCGNNGRAALITRGLNEITRIAAAKGANPLTMLGLAGMGDLVLTCTGRRGITNG